MKKMIQPDPKLLAARLNQPPTTLLERLEQAQVTMPLSESGRKLLEQLKADSENGPKSTASSAEPSRERISAAVST
jgi:hypothetical protein